MICSTGAAVINKTNGINELSIFVHINRFCETTSNQLQIRGGQKLSGKSLGRISEYLDPTSPKSLPFVCCFFSWCFSLIAANMSHSIVFAPVSSVGESYSESSNLLSFLLFADDTNLFISNKDIKKLCDNANQELCKAANWLAVNKLSINVKKTHFVIFRAKNKNLTNNISINIGNQNIEQVNSTNFLGLNID